MALYRTLLLCLTVVVMGILSGSSVATAQALCTTGDKLLDAQLYRQARAQYEGALKEEATKECGRQGLSKLAEIQGRAHVQYMVGQSYEAAERKDEAGDFYRASLKIDPTYEPALLALDRILNTPAQTPGPKDDEKFRMVETLLSLGLKPAAEEELKKIVSENPGTDVPPGIRAQFTGDLRYWHWAKDFLGPWLRTIGEILLLGVIAYFLYRAVRLRIAPATGVSVIDFEASSESAKGYKGMSSVVEHALSKSDEGEAVVRRDLVDGSIQPVSLSLDLSSILPTKFALLSTVMEWLLPSKVIRLSGMVHAPEPGSRGAGITLSLVESTSGEVCDTVTIWQKDFEASNASGQAEGQTSTTVQGDTIAYARLAEVAAIWAEFRLNKISPPDYLKKPRKRNLFSGPQEITTFTRLGTDSWESYALFRMGLLSSLRSDLEGARQLYYRALDKDDKNRGALFNLGAIEVTEHHYDAAIDLLGRARKSSESEACFHLQDNKTIVLEMVWYNTMYQLAAVHTYMGEDDPGCHKKALEYVNELVDTLQRTLTFLRQNKTPNNRSKAIWDKQQESFGEYQEMLDVGRLEKALIDFREGCLLTRAGILVANDKLEDAKTLYETQVKDTGKAYEPITLYNLACYFSQVGEKKRAEWRSRKAQRATVGAVAKHENAGDSGKVDTGAGPDDGTQELEDALKHLEASFEIEARKTDLDWAIEDPSLKGVRTDEQTHTRFLAIISKYGGRTDEGMPLSVVTSIGHYYACLLKEEKIIHPIQLLQRTMTQEARKELAGKLGVTEAALQSWTATSEMMVALDIEAPIANLLQDAGISSLAQLKDANGAELSSKMLEKNLGEKRVEKQLFPSPARITHWIETAELVSSKVATPEAEAAAPAKDEGSNSVPQIIRSLVEIFAGGTADNTGQGTSGPKQSPDIEGQSK